jgi:hypothetical protein
MRSLVVPGSPAFTPTLPAGPGVADVPIAVPQKQLGK